MENAVWSTVPPRAPCLYSLARCAGPVRWFTFALMATLALGGSLMGFRAITGRDLLPLNRGAGGRVLQAFAGARGAVYDRIRREGVAVLAGDRVPELTGISAPVFGVDGRLVGALTLTLPTTRHDPAFVPMVRNAARTLTRRLGGVDAP